MVHPKPACLLSSDSIEFLLWGLCLRACRFLWRTYARSCLAACQVQKMPEALAHAWVVKLDPDTVFIPERLGPILPSGSPRAFIQNCNEGLHGPIEVISREALKRLGLEEERGTTRGGKRVEDIFGENRRTHTEQRVCSQDGVLLYFFLHLVWLPLREEMSSPPLGERGGGGRTLGISPKPPKWRPFAGLR